MHVEIWSDIACPWCYVGKRRFAAALDAFPHRDEVTVTWRSFELDPEAPAEREGNRTARLAEKYGISVYEAQEAERGLTEVAAGEGLDFHFERARAGNTFDAHRVVHLGAAHGVQDAAKERLMRAYLSEGELMSDHPTLTRLAADVGLDPEETADMLAGDRFTDDVREDERTAMALGINAVPFFVVDRKFGAAGAQPPETLGKLLQRGWDDRPAISVVTAGEACGPDGC